MMDPPRPEARAAVARGEGRWNSGILITGDHPGTAAQRSRGNWESQPTIAPSEPSNWTSCPMGNWQLRLVFRIDTRIDRYFARGAHSVWLTEHGEVVKMTSDGVNDAPALKAARTLAWPWALQARMCPKSRRTWC